MVDTRKALGHNSMGRRNRREVLREIVLRGPMPRIDIAERVGLTSATVSRITRGLLDAGLVCELPEGQKAVQVPPSRAGPGRRSVLLDIAPQGGQVLGIGISPSFQTITLTDLKNQVIAGTELKIEAIDDAELVIRHTADEARRLIDRHLDDRRRLLGGFLMVSGSVDPGEGSVRSAPYLGWIDVPLRSKLTDLLNMPLKVESLPAAIALSEVRFGAARGQDDVLVLTCDLGISAGLMLNGRLVGRRRYGADTIGSAPIIEGGREIATLDQLAGGHAILRHLYGDRLDLRGQTTSGLARTLLLDAIREDRDGEPGVAVCMSKTGRELGHLTAQYVRLVTPEIVVIAGPLSMSPSYVAAAKHAIREGMKGARIDIVAGTVTGPVSGQSATCGLAICEYLFERTPNFPSLSASSRIRRPS